MEIKIQFDAAAAVKAMERSPEATLRHMRQAMAESCRLVQRGAREKHRFKSRTGALERAVRFRTDSAKCEGTVYLDSSAAPYGVFVHEPTGTFAPPGKRLPSKYHRWPDGSYAIRPLNKKTLRFLGRSGDFIFRKSVRHPGTDADRFLYEAAERSREEINRIFSRHVQTAAKEAGF